MISELHSLARALTIHEKIYLRLRNYFSPPGKIANDLRLKDCNGTEYFTDEEIEYFNDVYGAETTIATKPVHEFTRARIPIINTYCGLNITTETQPESLSSPTSAWTLTPWPTTTCSSTTKNPPPINQLSESATSEDFVVEVNTTKIVLHATTAKVESPTYELLETDGHIGQKPFPIPEKPGSPEAWLEQFENHCEKLNGLRTLVMPIFLIISRCI